jgi:hypothetical protein
MKMTASYIIIALCSLVEVTDVSVVLPPIRIITHHPDDRCSKHIRNVGTVLIDYGALSQKAVIFILAVPRI